MARDQRGLRRPLATTQTFRFNLIGTFFNQTLPSSIGGDAVRLWLVARGAPDARGHLLHLRSTARSA